MIHRRSWSYFRTIKNRQRFQIFSRECGSRSRVFYFHNANRFREAHNRSRSARNSWWCTQWCTTVLRGPFLGMSSSVIGSRTNGVQSRSTGNGHVRCYDRWLTNRMVVKGAVAKQWGGEGAFESNWNCYKIRQGRSVGCSRGTGHHTDGLYIKSKQVSFRYAIEAFVS
jgi:hypothetical protein